MLCTQCGGQLKDTANFCKYCGSKVLPEDIPKESSPIESVKEATSIEIEKTEPSLFEQAILADDQFTQSDPSTDQ